MRRDENLDRLRREKFDVVVIGGGAIGTSIALDAAARGLRTAVIERSDFASGTSSRSTKLVHGGVRYLEQAVRKLDRVQFALVREGLRERATLLRMAPHLTRPLALATPVYGALERVYLQAGLTLYDRLAGRRALGPTQFMPREHVLSQFPELSPQRLQGAVVYYDGQFDDARMCVSLALTAQREGATVLNYVEAAALRKRAGKVCGILAVDRITNEEIEVSGKSVVNATGPYADAVRAMDDADALPLLRVSMGIHLVFERPLTDADTGILIPKTDDGRILFMLPWQGRTLVGTTDEPSVVEEHPTAPEDQIAYLLQHVSRYLRRPLERSDVKAAWSGLRPLVAHNGVSSTAALARDHAIVESSSGLITVTGGKWTTSRLIAEEAVDRVVVSARFSGTGRSRTEQLLLVGAEGFREDGWQDLASQYGLEPDVATHLHRAYGSRAGAVAELAQRGYGARLAPGFPYVEAEAIWCSYEEYAMNAQDVLARRTRLSFLDADAARRAMPQIERVMAQRLPA